MQDLLILIPAQHSPDKLGFMVPYESSHSVHLSPEKAAAAIDALVGIGWMTNSMSEWTRKSDWAIRDRLNCSTATAERIWRRLRDQDVIGLTSDSNLAESGSMNSRWKWCKLEENLHEYLV
jgi:hypothetical protein